MRHDVRQPGESSRHESDIGFNAEIASRDRSAEGTGGHKNANKEAARELGLEPRLTEPKSVVLPLHYSRMGPLRLCSPWPAVLQSQLVTAGNERYT